MYSSVDVLRARFLRLLIFCLTIALFFVFPSISNAEVRIEEEVGKLLVKEFNPEKLMVQATEGGSFLYAKATGITIEGVRIDSVSLYAMMKEPPKDISQEDKYKLADLIYFSRGEVVILEKDLEDYTSKEIEDIKGFKDLKCDFSREGIKLSGVYTATFLFTFNVKLEATSKLKFDDNGLYLTDTTLYVAGIKQPQYMTSQLLERINPLISKNKIPFPVRITDIIFLDDRIVITGNPKPLKDANIWKYSK